MNFHTWVIPFRGDFYIMYYDEDKYDGKLLGGYNGKIIV